MPSLQWAAHEAGTARFEEAVTAFRRALREHARGPLAEWTSTRHGVANALLWSGTREGGTARLEEAVAAVEPVLTESVRERRPMEWTLSAGTLLPSGVATCVRPRTPWRS